jgi:hypothetical protein
MKISQFKKILKDIIQETLREEIRDILREELVEFGKVLTEIKQPEQGKMFNYKDYLLPERSQIASNTKSKKVAPPKSNNPLLNLIHESATNITPSEAAALGGAGEMSFTTQNLSSPQMPMMNGIDPDIDPSQMYEDDIQSSQMPNFNDLLNGM